MIQSKVEYAKVDERHVIRLSGEIRYEHILPLHDLLEHISSDQCAYILDLSHADLLDSTALGIMALVAKKSRTEHLPCPKIYVSNKSVVEILHGVCFDKIFDIIHSDNELDKPSKMEELQPVQLSFEEVSRTVQTAHRELAMIDKKNEAEFREVNKILSDIGK